MVIGISPGGGVVALDQMGGDEIIQLGEGGHRRKLASQRAGSRHPPCVGHQATTHYLHGHHLFSPRGNLFEAMPSDKVPSVFESWREEWLSGKCRLHFGKDPGIGHGSASDHQTCHTRGGPLNRGGSIGDIAVANDRIRDRCGNGSDDLQSALPEYPWAFVLP